MFDIGWGELLVIGVVALVAIGPKELPGVLRMVGQWVGKIRRMAAEFQGQFQEAMREAEMADVKRQMDEVTRELTSHYDPLEPVHKELERAADMGAPSMAATEPTSLPPEETKGAAAPSESDLPVDVSMPAPLGPALAPTAGVDAAHSPQPAAASEPGPRPPAGGSGSA